MTFIRSFPVLVVAALGCHQAGAAPIVEADSWSLDIAGDVKTFTYSAFPYEWYLVPDEALESMGMEQEALMPEEPLGQGALDGRLKAVLRLGEAFSLTTHARTGASYYSQALEAGAISLGSAGEGKAQVVDMSWQPVDATNYVVEGRVDRLVAKVSVPHVDIAVGRQPVSFGSSMMFTPMDLVAPFTPTDIDTEYKPGVDAARVDAYFGLGGHVTAVAAYAGDWTLDETIMAVHGSYTFGVTDIGVLAAFSHAEPVFGLNAAGSIGAVGWQSEATVTLPEDEDPFVRATLGGFYSWYEGPSLSAEFYYQSFGGADSTEYLAIYDSARFARGEVWAAGRYYGAVTLSYELTPLINVAAFSVVNITDPSAMIGPSLSWSAADNVELAAGAFFGAGERPHDIEIFAEDFQDEDGVWITDEEEAEQVYEDVLMERTDVGSEFGMIPAVAYVQVKLYF